MVAAVLLAVGASLLARLVQLQLVENDEWRAEAEALAARERSIPFLRGTIRDRAGVIMAFDEETYSINFEFRSFQSRNAIAQATRALLLLQKGGTAFEGMPTLSSVAAQPARAAERLVTATPEEIQLADSGAERGSLRPLIERLLDLDRIENRDARTVLRQAIRNRSTVPLRDLLPELAADVATRIATADRRLRALDERLGREGGETLRQIEAIQLDILADVESGISNLYERAVAAGESQIANLDISAERIRRRRQRESWRERFADDVPYEAVELLAYRPDQYPGFSSLNSTARRYAVPLLPWAVGSVRKPTAEELSRVRLAEQRFDDLSRQLERTDTEELEWNQLREWLQKTRFPAGDVVGSEGVEAWFEKDLHGERGFVYEVTGRRGGGIDRSEVREPRNGADVGLSLDLRMQHLAMELLKGGVPALPGAAARGSFAVIDVETGDVLALAATPDYTRDDMKDRKRYAELRDIDNDPKNPLHPLHHRGYNPWLPPTPGSSFKIVTAAAAMQKGIVTPATTHRCEGKIGRLHCDEVHGEINLREAIEQSCNCYFGWLGEQVGLQGLEEYAKRFGYIEKTGFHPGEVKGGFGIDAADVDMLRRCGVGYQIDVTPLQVARSYAAIANGGRIMKLRLVREVGGRPLPPEVAGDVDLPAETIQFLRGALRDVVAGARGTARKSGLADLGVAGKTGTAEVDSVRDLNHAWFAGYVPFDRPKIAFAVYLEKVPLHGKDVTPLIRAFLESPDVKRYISQ
jgi:cell division protein FtsI/penicillin-binding protein 2